MTAMLDCLRLWKWLSVNSGIDRCSLNQQGTSLPYYPQNKKEMRLVDLFHSCSLQLPEAQLCSAIVFYFVLLRSASFFILPHLFVSSRTVAYFPISCLLSPPSFLSLVLCITAFLSYEWIEFVPFSANNNRQSGDLTGKQISSSRPCWGLDTVCVFVHVYCWWGWGGRWGTGLCQRATQGHLLTCHPHSVCWTSERCRQMVLIIISSPVVRLGGLLSVRAGHLMLIMKIEKGDGLMSAVYVAMQRPSHSTLGLYVL